MKLDVLIIAAHPDDAEISLGGTILRLVQNGRKVGVLDVTRGEMGTRGDRASRAQEAAAAAEMLGLAARENLAQPDGRVQATLEARDAMADLIRRYRPDIVITHHTDDLHPDHTATGLLARDAWYVAGLRRLAAETDEHPAHRPRRLLHFPSHVAVEPTFVVDVGAVWERKVEVVRCYVSQLRPEDDSDDGEHFLFGADILERMTTKARYWGEAIGARYGEPLLHRGPLPADDPLLDLLR